MPSHEDFDDWARARRGPRRDQWTEPMPPHGLCERIYCGLKARTGQWPRDFLHHIQQSYGGKIPPRFDLMVERMKRAIEIERARPQGQRAMTITIVFHDGSKLIVDPEALK